MLKFNKIYLFLTALAILQVGTVAAQNTASNKLVKWEALNGKNNEFMIFMPEGYTATSENEFYLGKKVSGSTRVKQELKVARYLNGTVLLMDFYEGDAKEIYQTLKEKEKTAPTREEIVNGYQIASFSSKTDKGFQRTDYYFLKKSIYVVKGFAKSADDKILKGFFESVRFTNQATAAAPNVAPGAESTALPKIIEREAQRLDDSSAIEAKEADRPLVILKTQRPVFSFEVRRGISNLRVKMKVLYSSSGKVSNVEVLELTSKLIEKEAIEKAKSTVFIPAEKDGKLVSVYQTVEYSFGIETR